MVKHRLIGSFLLIGALALGSCNKYDPAPEAEIPQIADPATKETHKERFAAVLSKVVYEREDVRAFLKKEALVQFDKNYDVFYPMVRNKSVGGESFRDVLLAYSSEQELSEIERNVPLLNILLTDIPATGIRAEEMDTTDEEIPVAVAKASATSLYLNGTKEGEVEKGVVPGFHLFVVNENRRVVPVTPSVKAMASTRENIGRTLPGTSFAFKDPNYDGIQKDLRPLAWLPAYQVNLKTKEAYEYFYKDDGGPNQKGYQRDYVYYGITPQNPVGRLNTAVREYLSFIEVDPRMYYKISDQTWGGGRDPKLVGEDGNPNKAKTEQTGRELSHKELIDRMWHWGSYNFVFDLITTNQSTPIRRSVPLYPDQLWDFHITKYRRHSTWFRKAKYFYWIDAKDFTAKRVDLRGEKISFGPWNIAEEGLRRYVNIYEEDEGNETTISETYEQTYVSSSKFKFGGAIKQGLGLMDLEWNTTSTTRKTVTVTMKRKETSDDLGAALLYFYDPLIEGKRLGSTGMEYLENFHNTGSVKFGIEVK